MKFGPNNIPKEDLVQICGTITVTGDNGVLFNCNGREAWLPKQFFQATANGKYLVPIWLAKDKGFA